MCAQCEVLARRLLKSTDEREKDEIWSELTPTIELWAKLVCKNYRFLRHEFVDDAVSKVWEKFDQFDPSRGSFRTWVRHILVNERTDRFRKHCRLSTAAETCKDDYSYLRQRIARDALCIEDAEDNWRLTEKDLALLRSWPVRQRVHLCLVCGNLWKKVAPKEWESWLEDLGLPETFPPPGFEEIDNLPDRNSILAEAFCVSRPLINQWLKRSKHLACELECMREYLP